MRREQDEAPAEQSTTFPGLYSVPERIAPLAAHVPDGRTLFAVDIENLMPGGPRAGAVAFADAVEAFHGVARPQDGDHVVIGVNPALRLAAAVAFPGRRVVSEGGPDGADRALLDFVGDPGECAPLYHRIVIASGDGIFTELAERFVGLGLRVEVIARPSALARSLRAAAHAVRLIDSAPEGVAA